MTLDGVTDIDYHCSESDKWKIKYAWNLYVHNNCFGPPSLLVEGVLSTGPAPFSFYLLVEMGLPLHFFQHTCGELDQLLIKRHHYKDLKSTNLCLGPI